MYKLFSQALETHQQRAMRFSLNALCAGALAVGSIASADPVANKGDIYFFFGFGFYENMNSERVKEDLLGEFPGHTVFVGRDCIRYCPDARSRDPGANSLSLGAGYSLTDKIALELSWINGPDVKSTVVQAKNPVWHRAKNAVSGASLDVVFTHSLPVHFSLQGKAGLQYYSTRVSYGTYIGDGRPDDLLGTGSFSKNDLTASLSGGFWFSPQNRIVYGIDATYYVDKEFSFKHSVSLQMKFRPW